MEQKTILTELSPLKMYLKYMYIYGKDLRCMNIMGKFSNQGPVVQSIVSLPRSLVVRILTDLIGTMSNS